MKKVILMAILFSKAIIADDGFMTITGNILPSATVGFDAITEELTDNKLFFIDKEIILDIPLGGHIEPSNQNIYLKTNIDTGIKMMIEDKNSNFGDLVRQTEINGRFPEIAMKYKLMNSSYSLNSHPFVSLNNSIRTDGSSPVGTFVIEQYENTSTNKVAGTYKAEFKVTISANWCFDFCRVQFIAPHSVIDIKMVH